jgi:carboxymethylenebutenolidase
LPTIDIPAHGGPISAYLALPAGAGPAPGILVLHDAGGPSANCRAHADQFANSGFFALSVDPARIGGIHLCLREFARDIIKGRGAAFANLQACCACLAGQPGCNGRVGISGFCNTAGFALLLVLDGNASASECGGPGKIPDVVENFLCSKCPMIDDSGKRDAVDEVVARELEHALEKTIASLIAQAQPDAELMFMSDLRLFCFKLLRLPADGADTTPDFHRSVAGFFAHHLAAV